MELVGLLGRGRAFAEEKMTDEAVISRGGAPVFDPVTGVTAPASTEVHSGLCNVKMPTAVESERLFGEQQVTATRYVVWFPYDVTGVRVDDKITVTSSLDADLLSVTLKVVAVPRESHPLMKDFGCEVVE